MRTSLTRAGLIAAATGVALVLASCSSGPDDDPARTASDGTARVVEEVPGDGSPPTTINIGEGDYAFGVDRGSIAQAAAKTFAARHATADWEGDTLVVTMNGNTEDPDAGWTECRVVTNLVEEGDAVAFIFPNGRLECAEVLAE